MRRLLLHKNRNGSNTSISTNTGLGNRANDHGGTSRARKVDVIMQNAGDVLAIVKDASELGGNIPYLKTVAGLLEKFIEMKKVCDLFATGVLLMFA
jgi:hypothetical protein